MRKEGKGQMEQSERSKLLGTMPMGKLVPKISLPIMFSMIVQALYNIVDSIFVAKFHEKALTAVSLAFPLQVLSVAVGVGIGVGMNSLISRKLGEHRHEEALRAANNGLFLLLMGFVPFLIIGLTAVGPFYRLFTQDEEIFRYGTEYLSIVMTYSAGFFLMIGMERLLQATGNTMFSMATQLTGAVVNIILDPILIFGYLGFPAMGAAGAAIATVVGQFAGFGLGLWMNQTRNRELKLDIRGFRPEGQVMKNILVVGFPSIIMQSIGSLLTVLLNLILIAYGAIAVNVLGIYFKLQSFVFMPVFGLSSGLVAIVGYNFGARNKKRVYEAVRTALTYAVSIMTLGTVLFMAAPELLLKMFEAGDSQELLRIGVPALRIISLHFIFAACGIVLSTVFQAVGKGGYSLLCSVVRQLAALLPFAWLLSALWGLEAIWWCFLISETMSLVLCLYLYRRVVRRTIDPLTRA